MSLVTQLSHNHNVPVITQCQLSIASGSIPPFDYIHMPVPPTIMNKNVS